MPETEKKQEAESFEEALQSLEKIVDKMETGELPLEEALKQFEEGVHLTRVCQNTLNEAQQRVTLLTNDGKEQDFPQD